MHSHMLPSHRARRRVPVVALGLLVLLATLASPVGAVEPIDARDPGPMPQRTPEPVDPVRPTAPTIAPTPAPTTAPPPNPLGYDVSWPQCGDELPESFAFAIVGINRGRVLSSNPCFGPGDDPSQLEWAGRDADLYINTANPGPELSRYWPAGQADPRECDTRSAPGNDSEECAYLYGWNAAADAYARALEAFIALDWAETDDERIPGERTWWLDVETANSWRGDHDLNVAALRGMVDYLLSMEVEEVGFYSTPLLWWRITGGTDEFADHPSWHAGARNQDEAEELCEDEAFTGGELRMVQWVEDGIDTNLRCP